MLPSVQFESDSVPSGPRPSLPGFRDPERKPVAMVGSSPAWMRALDQARRAARTDADILLEAERGTGKELLARFIHQESSRANGPFVAINFAAVPDCLLESEMLGHADGAFSAGEESHRGKFALASGGTLLLDEIGEMPLPLQPKLLRVLQEREFYRMGGAKPVSFDARVIASTNRSLRALVMERRFHEDLYYRLSVTHLTLPPLRERGNDVVELAEYFAGRFAVPDAPPPLSRSFRSALLAYGWPGNIRELADTIRRMVTLGDGCEIGGNVALPLVQPGSWSGEAGWLRPGLSLRQLEKRLLEITLHATAGNRTHAAQLLGISLRTVRNKIREHGLPARRQT